MPGTPADYNGDGVLDLVTLYNGPGTLNVFLGRGDGDLELKTTFSSQGGYPSFSAPGDFDSDGHLDVAVTNYGSSNIALFRGDGLGNFEFKRTLSLTSAFGLVSRDFDGDGKLDLAVGQASQGGLSVFKGDGLGGFETPTFYATGSNPYHVTSADMDQDGAHDLLVGNYFSNNISILYGLKGNDGVPNGQFGAMQLLATASNPFEIAVGDIDNDGHLDVVSSSESSSIISVSRGLGSRTYATTTSFSAPGRPHGLALADFNGDNFLDIAAGCYSINSFTVWRGNGDGSFQLAVSLPYSYAYRVAVADFSGDGLPDFFGAAADGGMVSMYRNAARPLHTTLEMSAPAHTTLDTPINITVRARASDGTINTGFTGTVLFKSSDKQATMPSAYTFTAADAGVKTFTITPRTIGQQLYSATLASSQSIVASARVAVTGAEFLLSQSPWTINSGNGYAMPGTPVDYNGDGLLDVAVLNHQQSTLNILLGRGDGTLELRSTYSTLGSYPTYSASGDFNSDGLLDIALTNNVSGTLVLFHGDGLGNFQHARTMSVTSAFGLTAKDFDGDNKLDLIVGQFSQGGVVYMKGDGAGGFAAPVHYATGVNPYFVTSADMDKDGASDLLVTNYTSNNIAILYGLKGNDGLPNGQFGAIKLLETSSSPWELAVGDIDNDGHLDIVSSSESGSNLTVFTGIGQRDYFRHSSFATGRPHGVSLADFNDDGYLDIATGCYSINSYTIWQGNGDGGFALAVTLPLSYAYRLSVADFDGDGLPDLLGGVADSGVVALWSNMARVTRTNLEMSAPANALLDEPITLVVTARAADGTVDTNFTGTVSFESSDIHAVLPGAYTFTSADRGIKTFTVTPGTLGKHNYTVVLQGSASILAAKTVSITGQAIDFVEPVFTFYSGNGYAMPGAPADYNGDGLLDTIIMNHQQSTITVLLGTGDGKFEQKAFFASQGVNPYVNVNVDFNNDGLLDIIVSNTGNSTLTFFRGDGQGNFEYQKSMSVHSALGLVAKDFDSDGKIDLAVSNHTQHGVTVFKGDGQGNFSSPTFYATGTNPTILYSADMDADGSEDLVVPNYNSNTISILYGQKDASSLSNGQFDAPQQLSTGVNPYELAIGDVDNDGRLDIAVGNLSSSTVTVYRGLTNRSFFVHSSFSVPVHPHGMGMADLNGDGFLDVVAGSYTSNQFTVWQGQGDGRFVLADTLPMSYAYRLALADYSGDGMIDLLTCAANGGMVHLYRNPVKPIASQLEVSTPDNGSIARSFSLVVTARAVDGSVDTSFSGTVSIKSSDKHATLPGTYVFTPADRGVKAFTVTPGTLGKQTYSARLVGSASIVDAKTVSITGQAIDFADPGFTFYSGDGYAMPGAPADYNGDGLLDTIIMNHQQSTITVLLGTGDGKLEQKAFFASQGVNPYVNVNVDFNNDGLLDIIVSNTGNSTLTFFRGDGQGNFEYQKSMSVHSALGLVAKDFDSDGKIDLAVSNHTQHGVTVFKGDGQGNFSSPTFYSTGTNPTILYAADMDADGAQDLVVPNYNSHTVSILYGLKDASGLPNGLFDAPQQFSTGANPYELVIGDVDNDGRLDIVVGNLSSNTVIVYRGFNNRSFFVHSSFSVPANPHGMGMADLDGDGFLDVVVGSYASNQFTVWQGQGDGRFVLADTLPMSYAYRLALADYSGDGMIDLLTCAANGGMVHLYRNPEGPLITQLEVAAPSIGAIGQGFALVVSARTADGTIDVNFTGTVALKSSDKFASLPSAYTFTAADQGVKSFTITPGTLGKQTYSALLQGSSGVVDGEVVEISSSPTLFSDTLPSIAGGYIQGAMTTPADYDGDGLLDMAMVDYSQNTLRIFLGQGDGKLVPKTIYSTEGAYPFAVENADLNADGFQDVVVTNSGSNSIAVYLGTGTGWFNKPMLINGIAGAHGISIADVDGDQRLDLLVGHSTVAGGFAILRGLGDGTFSTATEYSAGSYSHYVYARDLDGDGALDLVVPNYGSSTLSILYGSLGSDNKPTGQFSSPQTLTAGANSYDVSMGDIDNDGILDIVTINLGDSTSTIYRGLGNRQFVQLPTLNLSGGPYGIQLADFNGDGKLDLATAAYYGGNVSVYSGQGNGSFALARSLSIPNAYRLQSADFDGNGMSDLFATTYGPGVFKVWLNASQAIETTLQVSAPAAGSLGAPLTIVVTARATDGSVDTSFNGTVVFKSSDKHAVLPPAYTFTAGDHGVKTFTITPGTLGKQTYSALLPGTSPVVDGDVVEVSSRPIVFSDTLSANPGGYGQGAMTSPADFDGDGLLDIAVVDSSQNTMRIFLGQGNGQLALKTVYSTEGAYPWAVESSDLNADGFQDLVVSNYSSSSIAVFMGTGTGLFQKPRLITGITNAVGISLTDIDGDNRVDLLVGHSTVAGGSAVLRGLGDGTFAEPTEYATGGYAHYVYARDIDNDGARDLLVPSYGNSNIAILYGSLGPDGKPTVQFSAPQTLPAGANTYDLDIGDIDNDGNLDLVTVNLGDSTSTIYRGLGSRQFIRLQTLALSGGPYGIQLADFNGDGKLDLATSTYYGGNVSVYAGQGNGAFVPTQTLPFSNLYRLQSGDFDGNGLSDLVATTYGPGVFKVWLNASQAIETTLQVSAPAAGSLGAPLTFVVTARATDGSVDTSFTGTVVFKSSDKHAALPSAYTFTAADQGVKSFTITPGTLGKQTYSALLQGSSGVVDGEVVEVSSSPTLFSDTLPSIAGGYIQGAMTTPADYDGDGLLDMAMVDYSQNTLRIFLGQGDGKLVPKTIYSTEGAYPFAVENADLNADGFQDVVVTNSGSNSIAVYLGTGTGLFNKPTLINGIAGAHGISIADVDGDQRLDLLVGHSTVTGGFAVLRGLGDGTFSTATEYSAGSYSHYVYARDLDGDGALDLVIPNYGSSTLSILYGSLGSDNKPTGQFSSPQTLTAGANSYDVSMGDIDNDGILDLVTVNLGDSTATIYRGLGNRQFVQLPTLNLSGGPYGIQLADFNGDGKLDLATAAYYGGNVSVYSGQGNGSFALARSLSIPNAYRLQSGDFDGNGLSDLVATTYGPGVFKLWLNASQTIETTLEVSAPANGSLDAPFSMVVTARGSDGSVDTGFTGTVTFQSSDPQATLPASYTFTAADRGMKVFEVIPRTAGAQKYSVVKQSSLSIAGSAVVNVLTNRIRVGDDKQLLSAGSGDAYTSLPVDYDNDGLLDLAVSNSIQSTLNIFKGRPDGTFEPRVVYSTGGSHPAGIDSGDFNGDGYRDMAVANRLSNSIAILMGNATGTFSAPTLITGLNQPFGIAVADYDEDGLLDIATSHLGPSGGVSILKGLGDGLFGTPTFHATGADAYYVYAADIDDDGILDLVNSNYSSGTVTILYGRANASGQPIGQFENPIAINLGTNVYDVALGDVNGDGRVDLATCNLLANTVTTFLNVGSRRFVQASNVSTGGNTYGIKLADLNGDGRLDLLTSAYTSGQVTLWAGRGDGTFESDQTLPLVNAGRLTAGDVNLDGLDDVVAATFGTANVQVWTNSLRVSRTSVELTMPSITEPDVPFSLTVTIKRPDGTTDQSFVGSVVFQSLDTLATLPGVYQFLASDQGTKTLPVTLRTLGSQLVTARIDGGTAFSSKSILVKVNQAPFADAGGPYTVSEGQTLQVTAANSVDSDGDALTFSWDINGDGVFGDAVGMAPTLSSSRLRELGIEGPATYAVRVRVQDTKNPAATSPAATLTVQNLAPGITVTGASTVNEGSVYSLNLGTVIDPGIDVVSAYTVHWGDGTSNTYSSGGVVTHTYADGLIDPNNNGTTRFTLKVAEDTYINDAGGLGGPASTHGSDPYLWSTNWFNPGAGGSLAARPMFKFDLSHVDRYTVTGDGVFRVYLNVPDYFASYRHGEPRRVDLYQITSPWNADTVNYYSHPSISYLNSQYIVFVGDNRWIEYTVPQSVIQNWIDRPETNHGLMLVNELPDSFFFDLLFASEEHPDNTPAELSWSVTGPIKIRIDLTDEDGTYLNVATHEVIVNNVTPVADSGGVYQVPEYGVVTLDGRGSFDPGNDIVRYEWDLDYQDGVFQVDATTSTTQLSVGDGPSQKRVALRVIDAQGAVSAVSEAMINVVNVPPTLTVQGPTTALSMQEVAINLSATDPSPLDQQSQFRFEIDWEGNGTDVEIIDSLLNIATARHTFTTYGIKNVFVRVRDKDNDYSTVVTHTINVQRFIFDRSLTIGGTPGNDTLALRPGASAGSVIATLNSVNLGTFTPTSILFLGGAGTDAVSYTGSDLPDTFQLAVNQLSLEGLVTSGVDIENWSITMIGENDTLRVLGGSATVNGGPGADQIISAVAGPVLWEVTGVNAGRMSHAGGAVQFTLVETLVGSDGDDTFRFKSGQRISSRAVGGAGLDTLDYSDFTTAVSVNLQTPTASQTSGIESIEQLVGGSGSDTLTGSNLDTNWQLTGSSSGLVGTTSFASFENLAGGSGVDRFIFSSAGSVGGNVSGGVGNDILDYSLATQGTQVNLSNSTATRILGTFTSVSEVVFPLGPTNTVVGRNLATTWNVSSPNSVTAIGISFTGVTDIQAGTGIDTLVGANTSNTWQVSGANAGSLSGINFTGVENLTGGSADDRFIVNSPGAVSGAINGGTGSNELDFSSWQSAVLIDLAQKTTTNVGSFSAIQKFVAGASSADRMIGEDNSNSWTISGINQGVVDTLVFEGIEQLAGGSGTDNFILSGGSVSSIEGGAGTDGLFGDAVANVWNITGPDAGTLNGLSFQSIERLLGSWTDDSFNISALGSIGTSISGGAGTDSLSYAQWSSPVNVNLSSNTATAAGTISSIEQFTGSSVSGDTFTGANTLNNWQIHSSGATQLNSTTTLTSFESLVGGTNVDTFNMGAGAANAPALNGGGGNDVLSYAGRSDAISIDRETGTATGLSAFASIEQFIGGDSMDTLKGANTATTWTIGAPGTGSFTGGAFSSIENLIGGSAADSFVISSSVSSGTILGGGGADNITGSNFDNTWRLTGLRSGLLNSTLAFSDIASVRGGTLTDLFLVEPSAAGFSTVDGNSGNDSLDYSSYPTAVQINLAARSATEVNTFLSIETLLGSVQSDTLIGFDLNTTWTLTDANAGRASTVNFQGFEQLEGGSGNDTFAFSGGSVDRLAGGPGTDTIIGPNVNSTWLIEGVNSGRLNLITAFETVENLTGNASSDLFRFTDSGNGLNIVNGGGGSDRLDYSPVTTAIVVNHALLSAPKLASYASIEAISGTSQLDTLLGPNTSTIWSLSAVDGGRMGSIDFDGFENLRGGTLDDSFRLTTDLATVRGNVDGGTGNDSVVGFNTTNSWSLTGANTGVLNSNFGFNGIEQLTGGTSTDTFTMFPSADFAAINGGAGADTLDYSNIGNSVNVNLGSKVATGIGVLNGMETIIGTSFNDALVGANTASVWSITSNYAGRVGTVSFQGFESLEGGSANDTFRIVDGLVNSISGGGGTDTFVGANILNSWIVDGVGAGSLNGGLVFSSLENLTGGTADDTFSIQVNGTVPGTLSGSSGFNTLSYAAWTTGVTINVPLGTATGITTLASNFAILIGGNGDDNIQAFSTLASVLIGNDGNDRLVGSSSRDILFGGRGQDTLLGGGGDDILFGGRSSFDLDSVALKALLAEWTSSRTYTQRINNLRNGPTTGTPLNGNNWLANSPVDTLFDDQESDTLTGEAGNDWFINGLNDSIVDQVIGEIVDNS